MVSHNSANRSDRVGVSSPGGGTPTEFGSGVFAYHQYSGQPGRLQSITLKSTEPFAKNFSVVISPAESERGQPFSVVASTVLSRFLPHAARVTDDRGILAAIKVACPEAQIDFYFKCRRYDYRGALSLESQCSSPTQAGLPEKLSDIRCPNTELELNSLKDAEKLTALVDGNSHLFADGAFLVLADASRLSVINRVEQKTKVTLALQGLAKNLRHRLQGTSAIVNRMGDEVLILLPATKADDIGQSLVELLRTPIVDITEKTQEYCRIRDDVEAIEARFATILVGGSGRSKAFIKHLMRELAAFQRKYGAIKDEGGRETGTLNRALRAVSKVTRLLHENQNLTEHDIEHFESRVAVMAINVLMRVKRRLSRLNKTEAFTSGATPPGAFDFATVFLSKKDATDPAQVELALNACAKLVGQRKRGRPLAVPIFERSENWRRFARKRSRAGSVIDRFNERAARYQQLRNFLLGIDSSRLLDRFALSAQLADSYFGHPHIEGVFQLRAILNEKPSVISGVRPSGSYQIVKFGLNLKPFNDMGYDLGDRTMRVLALEVRNRLPSASLFIEGGELLALVDSSVDTGESVTGMIARCARDRILNMMESRFFPPSGPTLALSAERSSTAKRADFQRRTVYSFSWKKLLSWLLSKNTVEKKVTPTTLVSASLSSARSPAPVDPYHVVVSVTKDVTFAPNTSFGQRFLHE